MARPETRSAALQLVFTTVGALVCLFAWVAILTFDTADWPSHSAWPQQTSPRNWCGPLGAWIAYQLFYNFGVGTYALVLMASAAFWASARRVQLPDFWLRSIGTALVVCASGCLATLLLPSSTRFLVSGPGGLLGAAGTTLLLENLDRAGSLITLASALLVGLLLSADQTVLRLLRWLGNLGRSSTPVLARAGSAVLAGAGAAVSAGVSGLTSRAGRGEEVDGARSGSSRLRPALRLARPTDDDEPAEGLSRKLAVTTDDAPVPPPIALRPLRPEEVAPSASVSAVAATAPDAPPAGRINGAPAARAAIRVTAVEDKTVRPAPAPPQRTRVGDYELPSIQLLDDAEPVDKAAIESLCREKAYILEQTLNEFRLEVQVVAIETGPVITVFELKLSPGIKVSQIMSLTNDMARALRAPAVRVVAPLPGKNTIGIEVPNIDKEKVRIKELIREAPARVAGFAIPLHLGKDASGAPLIADLTTMPHLLIAGTTGSGKSVCVGSIIMSILMTRTPEEVNLILVDPKVVELAMFKDVPHLICPIVTEMPKAEGILDWAATKMDERYELLAEAGVKDIRGYNKLGEAGLRERMNIASDDEFARIPVHLPYVVIVIDELADLMMTSAKEVEFYLCRLAQKSRAVGIHLIVSTQRPQANVVTGLIKSNLPCRIAFRVASRLDSRIVLDQNGGEVLMGQGDMLFLPPGSSKLVRAQGTFISDEELRAVVKHVRSQAEPNYHPELIRMPSAESASAEERDELFDQAVDVMIESGRGSVSLLQRRLNVGYGRASRLIDQMYAAGIVGDYKGSQAREVVITKEEWQQIKAQRDAAESGQQTEMFS
ncbi:MAG: DNA translocase FtsK 4TM domain-containing protein [Phycisphaerae bacterium]|jgi:S-DNA-T family DNA segregation ATPase FtsK/SpoIIIE